MRFQEFDHKTTNKYRNSTCCNADLMMDQISWLSNSLRHYISKYVNLLETLDKVEGFSLIGIYPVWTTVLCLLDSEPKRWTI